MMDVSEEEYARLEELARDVLAACRSALMMRFRYLDVALWKMPLEAVQCSSVLATDGETLGFDPIQTLVSYQTDTAETIRDLLHSVLHCIFRHPFDTLHGFAPAWHLACDITVESIALELCGDIYTSHFDEARKVALDKIEATCGSLSPKKLYRVFLGVYDSPSGRTPFSRALLDPHEADSFNVNWCDEGTLMKRSVEALAENGQFTISDLYVLAQLFSRDSHDRWASEQKDGYTTPSDKAQNPQKGDDAQDASQTGKDSSDGNTDDDQEGSSSQQSEQEDQSRQAKDSEDEQQSASEQDDAIESLSDVEEEQVTDDRNQDGSKAKAQDDSHGDTASYSSQDDPQDPDPRKVQAEHDWQDIARQIELDLEASSLSWDSKTGHLYALLPVANRKKYDYTEFLKQFITLNETIKISEDEFDYIFYTYGLKEYDNRPLIEPLEYQDAETVRDFVIAIDTSGSCKGELVRQFVQKTFDILKDGESFASKVNIHIIQCDASIQSDTKIQTKEDLKYFMDNFELRGFGGTDFRPVFSYVDELVQIGEFTDLRGLLYFTDGLGIYPTTCPNYDTAFIFMDDDMVSPKVPPWAMKVVLDEDEIRQF